jgi:2-polyprenyl-6-methoxyphenol hydroxylase-like FAD-dependent oxidoreductase
MQSTEVSPIKVTIVGGGIGGLTAALALLQRGIDVDVYEQSAVLKEVGAGVQLGSNGTRFCMRSACRMPWSAFRSSLPRAKYVTGVPVKPGTGSISALRRLSVMAHRTSCFIAATYSAFWRRLSSV